MTQIRVLVVDDDPWILRMVSSSLEKKGTYAVDTARDGQQALQKAPSDPVLRREFETLLRFLDDRQTLPRSTCRPPGPATTPTSGPP